MYAVPPVTQSEQSKTRGKTGVFIRFVEVASRASSFSAMTVKGGLRSSLEIEFVPSANIIFRLKSRGHIASGENAAVIVLRLTHAVVNAVGLCYIKEYRAHVQFSCRT